MAILNIHTLVTGILEYWNTALTCQSDIVTMGKDNVGQVAHSQDVNNQSLEVFCHYRLLNALTCHLHGVPVCPYDKVPTTHMIISLSAH